MLQTVKYICVIAALLIFKSTSLAQEQTQLSKISQVKIEGKWDGNLVVSKDKTIGILWRFEKSDHGKLVGFMGPASKGIATIPMQDLIYSSDSLQFKIQSQGLFVGKIKSKEIKGIWHSISGKKLTLYMARELTKEQLSQRFGKKISKNNIHQSIRLGDVNAVKTYVEKGKDINRLDKKGTTLLISAIKNDRSNKVVTYLLNNGANPNFNVGNISPLMYALAYGNLNAAKLLINHNANIDYATKDGQSAIVFAIKGRNKEALQLLLDNGADRSLKIRDNYTAIDLAKEENSREILQVMLFG